MNSTSIELLAEFGINGIVAGLVAALLLKSFFPGYLNEKGKNLATTEDFDRLLRQIQSTEQIKINLAERNWLRQQRWSNREKYYLELLLNLTRLRLSLLDRSEYYSEPGSEHNGEIGNSQHFQKLRDIGWDAIQIVREQFGPASVFLSQDAIDSLDRLFNEHSGIALSSHCEAEYVTDSLKLVENAYFIILNEAKRELIKAETDT